MTLSMKLHRDSFPLSCATQFKSTMGRFTVQATFTSTKSTGRGCHPTLEPRMDIDISSQQRLHMAHDKEQRARFYRAAAPQPLSDRDRRHQLRWILEEAAIYQKQIGSTTLEQHIRLASQDQSQLRSLNEAEIKKLRPGVQKETLKVLASDIDILMDPSNLPDGEKDPFQVTLKAILRLPLWC